MDILQGIAGKDHIDTPEDEVGVEVDQEVKIEEREEGEDQDQGIDQEKGQEIDPDPDQGRSQEKDLGESNWLIFYRLINFV